MGLGGGYGAQPAYVSLATSFFYFLLGDLTHPPYIVLLITILILLFSSYPVGRPPPSKWVVALTRILMTIMMLTGKPQKPSVVRLTIIPLTPYAFISSPHRWNKTPPL